jgi:hypothetical protein
MGPNSEKSDAAIESELALKMAPQLFISQIPEVDHPVGGKRVCPKCGIEWPQNLLGHVEYDRITWWSCEGDGCDGVWVRGQLPNVDDKLVG